MAYEILSESYGARLPKITATADSTDDLVTMGTNYAEGSTCVIGDKTYTLDKVQGWVEPGSGGGGGGVFWVSVTSEDGGQTFTADKTIGEIASASNSGNLIMVNDQYNYMGVAPASFDTDSAVATVVNVNNDKAVTIVSIGISDDGTGEPGVSYDVTYLQGT